MELAAASATDSDDGWELCNDDGFIYKRKRRRLHPSAPPPPDADDAVDKLRRNRRRKNTLLKIRDRYRRELALWERLSISCHVMHDQAQLLDRDDRRFSLPEERPTGDDIGLEALIDKLLLKVEAQEAVIQHVSNLCDEAESLCNARQEEFKLSLIGLPIWGSPRDLMAALCHD